MGGLITVAVFIVFIFLTLAMGVRIVPQGSKHLVQRLGKYRKTLSPGLNIIIPYIDTVVHKLSTKDQVLEIPSQEVITADNAVIFANAVAYINITSPHDAAYGVEDYAFAIQTLVQTSLRAIIGEMKLDDALSSRDLIKTSLKNSIADDITNWGVALKTVEIQDISPSKTMQAAMEEQAAAERRRRATVTLAEGQKDAAILDATGRLEAAKRDSEAKEIQAKASQTALQVVLKAAGDNNEPLAVSYLLGENYINAMEKLSLSDNTKVMVLPADLQGAIKGMFSMTASK